MYVQNITNEVSIFYEISLYYIYIYTGIKLLHFAFYKTSITLYIVIGSIKQQTEVK